MKNIHIHSYSGPRFPAFGLNTERFSVYLLFQFKCGKMMNVLPGAPLSPQKEGEDSKMYISESIGNSQGMLIEISESDAIAKIMI